MISNTSDIPLPLAVWAVADNYDFIPKPNSISTTSIIKPIKQIILGSRVTNSNADVEDFIASALGSAIHSGIEEAWKNPRERLAFLGYPDSLINKIQINPTEVSEDTVPVFIEQRFSKELDGYTISGKFDMVFNGQLNDFKSTSSYTWISGSKDEDYKLQGSIYRWLASDIIKENYIRINFIFTDWSKANAKANPQYPQHRILYKDIPLMSLEATEQYLKDKISALKQFENATEDLIPECTDKDLWRSPTKYKYFSDPTKTNGRATKVFDDPLSAKRYQFVEKAGKGTVIKVLGEVRRCQYCPAFSICKQREKYYGTGLLSN